MQVLAVHAAKGLRTSLRQRAKELMGVFKPVMMIWQQGAEIEEGLADGVNGRGKRLGQQRESQVCAQRETQ